MPTILYKQYITLSILLISIHVLSGRLTVFSPSELRDKFPPPKHDMDHAIASFGVVPRGKTLMGVLYYAEPHDGCSSMNKTLKSEQNENDPSNIPIVMVDRGNCTFTTKAKHAQLIGAKMLIIIDNKNENVSKVIMADDGHGKSISIPTVMIGKSSGQIIKDYLKENPESSGSITLIATFPFQTNDTSIDAQFWFSSADASAYPFLASFGEWVDEFGLSLKFTPHYIMWHSAYGKLKNWTEPVEDCISGGRFCAPDPDGKGPAQGETVVLENLRQLCIWEKLGSETWFHYIEEFGEKCISWKDGDCPNKIMDEMLWTDDQKEKVSTCMDGSFSKKSIFSQIEKEIDNNNKLQAEMDAYAESGVPYWPALLINHSPYKGGISNNSDDAATEICKLLVDKPTFCEDLLNIRRAPTNDESHYFAIFLIILGMVIVLILMLYIYKRMMRREMSKEMSIQISQMVSQYFALNEGGTGKKTTDNL